MAIFWLFLKTVLKDENRVPLTYNRSGRSQIYVDDSGCHYSHVALFNGMESHCTLNALYLHLDFLGQSPS